MLGIHLKGKPQRFNYDEFFLPLKFEHQGDSSYQFQLPVIFWRPVLRFLSKNNEDNYD